MAKKKSKRARKNYTVPRSTAPQPVAQPEPDLTEEYRYVLVDLRNMGILAAAMFALLVALALLLG